MISPVSQKDYKPSLSIYYSIIKSHKQYVNQHFLSLTLRVYNILFYISTDIPIHPSGDAGNSSLQNKFIKTLS